MPIKSICPVVLFLAMTTAPACDLCAVYRASDAQGETGSGLVFSLAEQFVPSRTAQFRSQEVHPTFREHVDSSITHLVASYNFTPRFGLSLNVPLTHLDYRRRDVRYSLSTPPVPYTEDRSEAGMGDVALIGRLTLFQHKQPRSSIFVNALVGVKFPTGDDSRLDEEIDQTRIYDGYPGPHSDPLEHSSTSVHLHSIALGSGSFDGIFGLTVNANWQRWFLNCQFQYYLRTEGDSEFKYGDELMVSGGPGFLLVQTRTCSLGLQVNAVYDWMSRDELLGRISDRTGMTAWYLGPLLTFSWGTRFSANAGVDVPLQIRNAWFQTVPNYRLHGGVSWNF